MAMVTLEVYLDIESLNGEDIDGSGLEDMIMAGIDAVSDHYCEQNDLELDGYSVGHITTETS